MGSISLTGAIIDDLTFKKYTETLNGDDNVVLLNPRESKNGYYVENTKTKLRVAHLMLKRQPARHEFLQRGRTPAEVVLL